MLRLEREFLKELLLQLVSGSLITVSGCIILCVFSIPYEQKERKPEGKVNDEENQSDGGENQ